MRQLVLIPLLLLITSCKFSPVFRGQSHILGDHDAEQFCKAAVYTSGAELVGSEVSLVAEISIYSGPVQTKYFLSATCSSDWSGEVSYSNRSILLKGVTGLKAGQIVSIKGTLEQTVSPVYPGPAYHFFISEPEVASLNVGPDSRQLLLDLYNYE